MYDLEWFQSEARSSSPILDFIDLQVVSMELGRFKALVPLSERTKNHVGIIHASIPFALGEFMGGLVALACLEDPDSFKPLVRDVKIDYPKPGSTDLIAECRFTKEEAFRMNQDTREEGRHDFELHTSITNTTGAVVAKTVSNYAIRKFSTR